MAKTSGDISLMTFKTDGSYTGANTPLEMAAKFRNRNFAWIWYTKFAVLLLRYRVFDTAVTVFFKEIAMYRVGFPGWKLAARFHIPLLFKVVVTRDPEAGVFVATSPDVAGLVVESATLEALLPEVYDCAGMLLSAQLKHLPMAKPVAAWDGDFCAA